MSDAIIAYMQLTQQDDESTSKYLIRANILLKCMNHTSKPLQITGKDLNNLAVTMQVCGFDGRLVA